ncbi:retrovirus-related pol polyprotein from transposon TNT 1-94, partial [Tanacetum coccineum]
EEEFEEEEPQEEEDDIEVDIEEEENEPELIFPYVEVDPLNPPPPASDSEPEDVIVVEDMVEPEDETVPTSVYEVGESSTASFHREDSDGLLPGFMRRDINSLFGRMTSLSRRLCGRETTHALVEKKGKAKDKYYGKLILDLGNELRSSVEEGMAAMENLVRKLGNAEEKTECKELKKELEESRLSTILLHCSELRLLEVKTASEEVNAFNSIKDAKSLLQAVEKRFGGNAATKKTQRNLLNLSPEWNTHTIVWRNKPKIDTLSLDDLYNNLKIYEPEVKGTSSSSINTQNAAFMSSNSTSSTNGAVNTAHGATTASTQATVVNSTTIDNLSDAVFYRFKVADGYAKNEGKEILEEDWKEIKQKKVQLTKQTRTILKIHSEFIDDVNDPKTWGVIENVKILKEQNEQLLKDLRTSKLNAIAYKIGLESVEARLLVYKKNESVYEEDIKVLKCEIHLREVAITELRRKLELAQKQKDEIQLTVENFENSSKSLSKLIDCQIVDKCKTGLGYNAVPPPYTGNFMPPKPDLSFSGLEEFVNEPIVSEPTVKKPVVETSEAKASADKPKDEAESKPKIEKKTVKPSFAKIEFVKSKKQVKSPRKTTNKQDYEEIDGGYVAFGGNPKGGKITGKVVTDDYSRFSWVFFLATKDETSGILKSFITRVENLIDQKVKVIRCDNGTEFKNKEMNQFCERKVLHTMDHLGKFDGKTNEGFFVGYSINSKAFRVFNSRTRIVEENLHVQFSKDTPNIAGSGPNWLFDIDALTKSMNYKLVVAGNQSNGNAGTKACDDVGKARMETSYPDDGSKPSSDDEKKVDEDPRKDNESIDQENDDNVNSLNNVNDTSTKEVNASDVGAKADMEQF